MPTYEYTCKECDTTFEASNSVDQRHWATCPKCGDTNVRRVYNPTPSHFKGTGFYRTDNR
jgi:putative FmdB family regulatory protein